MFSGKILAVLRKIWALFKPLTAAERAAITDPLKVTRGMFNGF